MIEYSNVTNSSGVGNNNSNNMGGNSAMQQQKQHHRQQPQHQSTTILSSLTKKSNSTNLQMGSSNNKWTIKCLLVLYLCILFIAFISLFYSFRTVLTSTSSTIQQQQQSQIDQMLQSRSNLKTTTSSSSVTINKQQQQQQQQQKRRISKGTIAYAVTVTGCGADPITEGAAVLQHSIYRTSIYGNLGGQYNYKMYAFYHPTALQCVLPLQQLNYTLLERSTFINVSNIQGEYLRTHIEKNGCCGEKELIKLEAYTLIEYPIVVHLDLDVLLLQPLDDIFDWMLSGTISIDKRNKIVQYPITDTIQQYNVNRQQSNSVTDTNTINAFYTIDYNMANPTNQYNPVQGGFLIIRPNLTVYEEYKAIVLEGNYQPHSGGGWGGVGVGPFYGSLTFQGIIPYYYNYIKNYTQSIELNYCYYNNMANNPRTGPTKNDIVSGECRTGQEQCTDCRSTVVSNIITTHFTLCQKPWGCTSHNNNRIQERLCRQLTKEWYKVRSELEQLWGRSGYGSYYNISNSDTIFYGYCNPNHSKGQNKYEMIQQPYGK